MSSTASNISVRHAAARLEVPGAQALHHVVVDLLGQALGRRLAAESGDVGRHRVERGADQFAQVERDAGLDQDPQHAERGAAQAIRVLGAGRLLADREDADQRVELVADGEREAGAGRRQGVAGEAGQVLLGDARWRPPRLAVVEGVVAAHDALQFRELPDHGGQQVALGEFRGALRRRRSCPATRAIWPARAVTRADLSASEPSWAWKVTAASAARRESRLALRSAA